MFASAAGSTVFIGPAYPDWQAGPVVMSQFASENWTPVEGVSSLGRVSGEWQTQETVLPGDDCEPAMWSHTDKTVRPTRTMEILVGLLPDDFGQLALIAAEDSVHSFSFRIVLPGGQSRYFIALVVAAEDIIEDGSEVLGLAFSLRLQSNIAREEASL